MKKLICCLLYFTVLFCSAQNNFNIVPAPASIQFIDTSYTYDLPIQIVHTKSEAAVFNAVYLLEALKERNITGNLVAYDSFDMNRSKIMLIDEDEPTENYRIITPGKDIIVSGNNRTIFFICFN